MRRRFLTCKVCWLPYQEGGGCSPHCRGAEQRSHLRAVAARYVRPDAKRRTLICQQCGLQFNTKYKRRFCSDKCDQRHTHDLNSAKTAGFTAPKQVNAQVDIEHAAEDLFLRQQEGAPSGRPGWFRIAGGGYMRRKAGWG